MHFLSRLSCSPSLLDFSSLYGDFDCLVSFYVLRLCAWVCAFLFLHSHAFLRQSLWCLQCFEAHDRARFLKDHPELQIYGVSGLVVVDESPQRV